MIYSIVPFDQLLFSQDDNQAVRMDVTLEGEHVVLLRNENNTYTVERLISTNPKAYLKPEFTPGTLFMTITAQKETPNVIWTILNK